MDNNSYTIEAILKARDAGFSAAIDQAANKTSTLNETIRGMAGAQLAMKGLAKTWDLISSSVGKAMGRIDTMDQFNRTMKLMTGSSDMAAMALDRVNDAVKGTAYGLDVASSAVQGFVSSGKDVDESIDIVTNWGDALATFGQASNENLASVSIALQKMGNSGKVSTEKLQMLTDRGIPALEIFAEATGKTTAEVSEQISKGELSAQEFFDVMNRAFTEGTERFPAVAGAAKEAGASWSATFDNMKAAVTRGVQSIITSVEDGRAKSDLPGMKDAVSGFGKSTEKVLKGVSKATGFVAENFESFESVATTALAGVAAHKAWGMLRTKLAEKKTAAMEAQEAFSKLAGEQKGMLSISDLYTKALADESNAEKMRKAALELGLVVDKEGNILKRDGTSLSKSQQAALLAETGAITAKTLAHAVLTGQMKITTAAQIAFNAALKANPIGIIVTAITAAVKGLKALTDWMNKSNKELQQAKKDADAQAKAMEELNGKEMKFKQSFERTNRQLDQRKEKADKIISSMKDLSKQTGDAEDKTKAMSSKVEALKKLYPDLVAAAEPYQDVLKKNIDSLERQVNMMDQLSRIDAWKKHTEDLQEYRDQMEIEMSIAEGLMKKMEEEGTNTELGFLGIQKETGEYAELKKQFEDMTEAYQRAGAEAEIAAGKIAEFDEQQVKSTLSAEQAKVALENLTATYGISQTEAQAIIDYNERMGESFDANAQKIIDMADKMGIGAASVVTIMDNLGKNADELSKHYDEVYEHVSGVVDNLVKAANSGFEEIKQNEALTWEEIETNLENNRQAIETWSQSIDTLMTAGVDQGVIAKLKEMGPEGAEQARVLAEELENANGTVITKGEKISDDAQAIVETVNGKFKDLYKAINEASETELNAEKYIEQGKKPIDGIVQGLATGIVENEAKIKSSGKDIMDKLGEGAEEGKEPLKKTFEDTGDEVLKSVDETGEEVEKSVEDAAENVNEKVDEGGKQLNNSISETSNAALKGTESLVKQLNAAFDNLPAELKSAGQNSIQGLIDGINSMRGAAYNAMAGVARQAVAAYQAKRQSYSSSKFVAKQGDYTGMPPLAMLHKGPDEAAYQAERQGHSPSKVMAKQSDYTSMPLLAKLHKGADEAAKLSSQIAHSLTSNADMNARFSAAVPMRAASIPAYSKEQLSGGTEMKIPAEITLVLAGRAYRAFSNDIFNEHDKQLRLEGNYAL